MCGIAGIYNTKKAISSNALSSMLDIITHRGPDDAGTYEVDSISMGMRRLSIIDVSGGHQPIFNEDESIVVIMNGELFNYIEVRDDLIKKGHTFRTQSDTEILVHLYEEYGTDFLHLLNGMFAFAIWDTVKKQLFIARDRMGIKPLYYSYDGTELLFGSELKSITTLTQNFTISKDAIADYLRYAYVSAERTPIEGVYKLLPGHALICNSNGLDTIKWWDLKEEAANNDYLDSNNLIEQVKDIFDDAVRIRMRSDVPVASFLSGGLDSSLTTALASKYSDIKLKTYNVKFEQTQFDETSYAKEVAERYGTEFIQVEAKINDALEILPLLMWHLDEPIADSAAIPNYLVSALATKNVKVCLSGLGGDELFGGYGRYAYLKGRVERKFSGLPQVAGFFSKFVTNNYINKQLKYAANPDNMWSKYLQTVQILPENSIAGSGLKGDSYYKDRFQDLWMEYPLDNYTGRCQYVDMHTYLPDQILAITDKMSMATSLESRVPFLDYRLIQLSLAIPDYLKQNENEFKIILKKALGDKVPDSILNRPKWGFDAPFSNWLQMDSMVAILKQLPELLSDYLSPDYIASMVTDKATIKSNARILWAMLTLAVWLKVYKEPSPPTKTLTEYFA